MSDFRRVPALEWNADDKTRSAPRFEQSLDLFAGGRKLFEVFERRGG